MTYRAIADNDLDAYSPVTSRLMKGYRDNILATAVQTLSVPAEFTFYSAAGGTYTDSGTVSIYIPAACSGAAGTRLYLPTKLVLTVPAGDQGELYARWNFGASYSDVTSTTASGGGGGKTETLTTYLTLDCSASAGTVNAFVLQSRYANATTASVGFDDTAIRGYIAPLPYPGGY